MVRTDRYWSRGARFLPLAGFIWLWQGATMAQDRYAQDSRVVTTNSNPEAHGALSLRWENDAFASRRSGGRPTRCHRALRKALGLPQLDTQSQKETKWTPILVFVPQLFFRGWSLRLDSFFPC